MHLWCKTSQNIWPLFSKYLPLHHLTPEWWNGRHEGLKIPWPLRLYEFESRFRHFPSVELLSRREFFCCSYTPYMYMGWYCPKEGKNNEKLTYYFVDVWKLICQPYKMIVYALLVRVRTCARLPTAMLFFCCHKCHTPRKKGQKNSRKFSPNRSLDPEQISLDCWVDGLLWVRRRSGLRRERTKNKIPTRKWKMTGRYLSSYE